VAVNTVLVLLLPPSLLCCRLANEITNLSDAATLYPLFGLGANLAQALAGMVLKVHLTCGNTCRSGAAI
jgi:AAA family ATP:ADP antiporter